MLSTLTTIIKENWEWRGQIAHLALFDLVKQSRGAVLSWTWFFIRPAIYIFCFWFALDVGLRAGNSMGLPDGVPYIVWLAAGIIPWFFMQKMITAGCNVFKRFPYLVNKIKFPLSGISTIFTESNLIIEAALLGALLVIYLLNGMPLDIYLLQVPILLVLLFAFWNLFSIMMSPLSAISKDVAELIKALSTPLFWLSGVIFNVKAIPIDWVQLILQFNPVTFFVVAFRDAFCDKVWFWEDPALMLGFGVVFLITFVMALWVYKKLSEEVADVL